MSSVSDQKQLPRELLIPLLQEAQTRDGFISRSAVDEIASKLNISTAKVYGVASFYNQFTFTKPGKYVIKVCRGTACHVKGSERLLNSLLAELKVKPGDCTRDGLFTVEIVACIGACGLAPVIAVNDRFHGRLSPADIPGIIQSYREMEGGEK